MDPRIIEGCTTKSCCTMRTEAAEFAREYPDRAARLALDDKRVEDPTWSGCWRRGLPGRTRASSWRPSAALHAAVGRGLLFPSWLAPTPSCAVLRFEPDPADADLANGVVLKRGTGVRGSLPGSSDIRCDFQTGRDLPAAALRLADASTSPPAEAVPELRLAEQPASSLRIELG